MQFSTLALAAAILSGANAVVQLTNSVYNDITAGQPYIIGWSDAAGPVTLTLKNGGANNLQTVSIITSGQTTSPFTWNVPSTLPADTYAIEISDGTDTNFSPQFQLLGATATASSTGSSSASASSSASSSISSSLSSASSSITSSISSLASSSSTLIASTTGNSTATAKTTSSGTSAKTSTSASKTASGSSSTGSSTGVPSTNSGSELASPLALVFLTFAAIFTLN